MLALLVVEVSHSKHERWGRYMDQPDHGAA